METKTIVQYVVAGVIVVGSLFVAYNAQDKITGQASEIKALQNQVAVLTDQAAQNENDLNACKSKQCLKLIRAQGYRKSTQTPTNLAIFTYIGC